VGLSWILPFHRGFLGHVRRDDPYSTAEHVRLALEELGTTAIKLGQILSTRPDLVPPELEAELEKLRDRVPPVPTAAIVSVIEREMGVSITAAFERFDPEPIASASIGQVHGASLRGGTSVVVKVRKPGVAETVNADLAIAADLAHRIARTETERGYDVVALADDFAWTLRSELDYVREAQNAERLRTILAENSRIVVPEVHQGLSTGAVLVMERIEGVGIGDLQGLDSLGVDRAELARISAEALMAQVFGAGFFHADPHPGNFLVLADGRIAMLDFGMVGRLDDDTKRALVGLLLATSRHDATMMVGAMEALGVVQDPAARTAVRRDLRRLLDDYYGLSVDRFDLSAYLKDVLAIVRRNHLQLPTDLATVLKTIGMSEGLWRRLDPSFNATVVVERFVREHALEMVSPAAMVGRSLHAIVTSLERGAGVGSSFGVAAAAGASGANAVPRSVRTGSSRIATAVVAASFMVSAAILATVYRPPGWSILRPLWFFGAGVIAAVLLISLRISRHRR
jgi:ubiquinone biosynthesis protein